jgi:hypothetical protein
MSRKIGLGLDGQVVVFILIRLAVRVQSGRRRLRHHGRLGYRRLNRLGLSPLLRE